MTLNSELTPGRPGKLFIVALMEATKCCSLGSISHALCEFGTKTWPQK
jgi:hypothetical protein